MGRSDSIWTDGDSPKLRWPEFAFAKQTGRARIRIEQIGMDFLLCDAMRAESACDIEFRRDGTWGGEN